MMQWVVGITRAQWPRDPVTSDLGFRHSHGVVFGTPLAVRIRWVRVKHNGRAYRCSGKFVDQGQVVEREVS